VTGSNARLVFDEEANRVRIDELICTGCGVCVTSARWARSDA